MKCDDLCGYKINLIAVSENGLEDMHAYSIKPEFYRYLEYKPFNTLKETSRYLRKLIAISNSPTGHYWFIKLQNENKIIGTIGLVNINEKRLSADIGHGVSPSYSGKGYIFEAYSLVLNYFFGILKFQRINATTASDNHPTRVVLETAGFKKEGHFRQFYRRDDGERFDAFYYGLLKNEVNLDRCHAIAKILNWENE